MKCYTDDRVFLCVGPAIRLCSWVSIRRGVQLLGNYLGYIAFYLQTK